jgi:hypothetical protein
MNISKLKYTDKETALTDLITKNVIDVEGNYQQGIQAVVEIGEITLTDGTYDNEGNVTTEPIYADGYHYDVMSEQDIDFGNAKIEVNNPRHTFAGY